jgi:hypothetical protein
LSTSFARPPGGLEVRFLRLEYWYDRLSEPQRVLVGLAGILFLAAAWMYVLGVGSSILVSRTSVETDAGQAEVAEVRPTVSLLVPTAEPGQPTPVAPTAAPTPSVEAGGNLIAAPDVPEVTIIPPPPRQVIPVQPLKPRVVATTPTPGRTVVPTPTQRSGPATAPSPGPVRTSPPTNATPARPASTPARTAAPTAAAPAATKPAASTPVPTSPRQGAAPTPTRTR